MKEEARLIEQQNKEQLTKREAEEAAYELGLHVCVSVCERERVCVCMGESVREREKEGERTRTRAR